MNVYLFGSNSPVRYIDPSGRQEGEPNSFEDVRRVITEKYRKGKIISDEQYANFARWINGLSPKDIGRIMGLIYTQTFLYNPRERET